MKKRIIKAIIALLVLIGAYWAINPRGIVGLVAHTSDYKVNAYLSTRGWAKWNGRYKVGVYNGKTMTHSLTIRCSTPQFPVMHSLSTNTFYIDEASATLVIDLPSEKKVTIAIK